MNDGVASATVTRRGLLPVGLEVESTMEQQTLGGRNLTALRAEYERKVTEELPERARRNGDWPIRADHCFGRVVLDALFEDEWYEHVDGSPAYEQLSAEQLREAIRIADRLIDDGRPAVEELNRRSLRWRGES